MITAVEVRVDSCVLVGHVAYHPATRREGEPSLCGPLPAASTGLQSGAVACAWVGCGYRWRSIVESLTRLPTLVEINFRITLSGKCKDCFVANLYSITNMTFSNRECVRYHHSSSRRRVCVRCCVAHCAQGARDARSWSGPCVCRLQTSVAVGVPIHQAQSEGENA